MASVRKQNEPVNSKERFVMKARSISKCMAAAVLIFSTVAQAQYCIDAPTSFEAKAKRLLERLQKSGNGIYCSEECSGVEDITNPESATELMSQLGNRFFGIRVTQFIPYLNQKKICLIVTNR